MARTLAFDSKYMSPFARNARLYGYHTIGKKFKTSKLQNHKNEKYEIFINEINPIHFFVGGKPDDVS